MRIYGNIISLNKNARGVYCLDTTMGCRSGVLHSKGGCYGDCYSVRSSRIYGYDFSQTVIRNFRDNKHRFEIISQINKMDMPFVRIGSNGDPSEAWQHTIDICKQIQDVQLNLFFNPIEIVIITKHWELLTDNQLEQISKLPICINTSVSALDETTMLNKNLNEFNRLKPFCKSILRIVSCDFNLENIEGFKYSLLQYILFKNSPTIDTVFRPSKNNQLIKDGIINVHKTKFLGKNTLVSKLNKKTYFGKCGTCIEKCGHAM